MSIYDNYKQRLTVFGETRRERSKSKIQRNINNKLVDHLSCKDVLINDEQRNLICINVEKLDEKDIKSMPNESFATGDEVVFAGSHWLVIKADVDDEIYMRGTMKRCDTLVRWQNIETLEIIEQWAIDSRPYTSNLNIDRTIVFPKKEFILQFRSNEETKMLGVNKRLLLYEMYDISSKTVVPIALTIQAYNPVNIRGIIELNVVEDASYNAATDNAKLMIADYIDPTITINLIPIPELLLGNSIQIQYEFYQRGELVNIIPNFESSDEEIATVDENGVITAHKIGDVQITVSPSGKYASETINIDVVSMQISKRMIQVTGVDSILNNRSAEYTGFIFDNGIRQSEKVFWSLNTDGLTGVTPTLSIVDDNSVIVNTGNNDRNVDKSFILICRDGLNTLVEEKTIRITSLFG